MRTCTCNRQHKATTRVEVMLARQEDCGLPACQRNGARQEDVIENEQWQSHGRLSGEAIWLSWPWSGFLMEEVSDRFICAPRFRQRGGNITWSLTYVVKFLRKHVGSRRVGWKQQNSFCLWHFFPVFLIEFTVLSGNNTSTRRGKNIIVLIEIKWCAEIAAMERLLLAGQSSYLTISGPGWYKICTFVCDLLCYSAFVDFFFFYHCSVNNSGLKHVSLNKTNKIRCLIKQRPLWRDARFIFNLLQISLKLHHRYLNLYEAWPDYIPENISLQ